MPKKQNTFIADLLAILAEASDMMPLPLEAPYQYIRRLRSMDPRGYRKYLSAASKQGYVEIKTSPQGEQFLSITNKGQLELLFQKVGLEQSGPWDGKWRLIIFDIPEDAHAKRDKLRWLLKRHNFTKLQGSVFISPYALNREAIQYLHETGLHAYIRILKVEEIDTDADLLARYGLKKPRP